jgi:putative membrane protein
MSWQAHPDAWLLVIALAGGYLYALSAWGPEHAPGNKAATRRQQTYFLLGVAALWLGADWPVDALAERWFSIHMIQHLLFSFVAAPLMILGTPGWLFRKLLSPRPAQRAVRFLSKPVIALAIFNGWAAGYHWPATVNLSVTNDAFHFLVHVVWVAAGLVMWWPVLSPLPELPHYSYPGRMVYLFGQSVLPTVPASFLTFGTSVWYAAYEQAPALFGLSSLTDQRIAGLVMKIGAGLLLWSVIAALFFRWQYEEEHNGPDILYWRDIAPGVDEARIGTQGDRLG